MTDEWIYYMTITKFKVHRNTGQVESQGGFTKIIEPTRNVKTGIKKSAKAKTVELFSKQSGVTEL